jgi:hypothetical protein
MNNFLYQNQDNQPKKYTLNDLNDALGEEGGSSAIGGGVWGSVANAAKSGSTQEMQQKLAKLQEMKR